MNQFKIVAAQLAALGLTITNRPGEYCVNFRGGGDATAYFTDDLDDALDYGRRRRRRRRVVGACLVAERGCAPPELAAADERQSRAPGLYSGAQSAHAWSRAAAVARGDLAGSTFLVMAVRLHLVSPPWREST